MRRVAALEKAVASLAADRDKGRTGPDDSRSHGRNRVDIDHDITDSVTSNMGATTGARETTDLIKDEIVDIAGICNDDPDWEEFLRSVAEVRRDAEVFDRPAHGE